MKKYSGCKIFAVEDDSGFVKILKYALTLDPEHEVTFFEKGGDLLNQLHEKPDIITLDYSLPDMSGEEVLRKIKHHNKDTAVIVISGQQEIRTAVKLLKEGAYDYIAKDEDIRERLLNTISNIKRNLSLANKVEELQEKLTQKFEFESTIIGQSEPMKVIFQRLSKAIKTNITVSIYGETGTGKELIAQAIHFNSIRKKHPFVPVNISAIPDSLLESELFGHEKGAFTGAVARRVGKFEEAHKGTIFLDEIGEMDINLQAKLLRVLQERELTRIGGSGMVKLDVRVITATNRNLAKEVKEGKFRQDLYYRLLGLPIELPPLRERGNDALIIAKAFINNFCKENHLEKITLTPEAQKKLLKYPFPGNVRELKAVIELAVVMCEENKINAEDIQFNNLSDENYLLLDELTLRAYIFKIVKSFLNKYNDDILIVAKKLDIGKSTIYKYLNEMEKENYHF